VTAAYVALRDAALRKDLKATLSALGFDARQIAAIRGMDGIDADFLHAAGTPCDTDIGRLERHLDEVAHGGFSRGGFTADIGSDAADDDGVDATRAQDHVQVGAVERPVARLGQARVGVRGHRGAAAAGVA